jgi:hypothetical protein
MVLGFWSAWAAWQQTQPTSVRALGANHRIQPGDLQTPEIATLTNRYLLRPVQPGGVVTGDIVGDTASVPVIGSGFVVIVNIARSLSEQRQLFKGEVVQIRSGGQPLGTPGTIRGLLCDENRCAVAVALDRAPSFDPLALQGADVEQFHPSASSPATQGGK